MNLCGLLKDIYGKRIYERLVSNILHECLTNKDILESVHKGVVFDKIKKNDGSKVYMVYLEGLKMVNRMKTYEEYENNTKHKFKIYIYEGEYRERKKVRIMRV